MNDIPTYNHSKPEEPAADRPSIFHIAAKVAFLGVILGNVFLRAVAYGMKDTHSVALLVGLGGATLLLNISCLILGVFALCGIFRYGVHGILIRGVLGILISGLLLGAFGVGFVHGFQAALKRSQMMVRARTTPEQSGKEIGSSSDSNNNANSPDTNAANKSSDSGNGNTSDENGRTPGGKALPGLPADMSVTGRALTIYGAKQQTLITAYDAAALAIKTPPVLSMKDLTQREQLLARKNLVNQFLDANEKWLGFSTKAEVTLRAEMVKLHASPATIDAGLKDYRQASADRDFVVMQIRSTDQRIGTASLDMLTLLEANWGRWKYNTEKNTLSFEDKVIAGQYNDSFAELNAAKADQAQLQKELERVTASATPPDKPAL